MKSDLSLKGNSTKQESVAKTTRKRVNKLKLTRTGSVYDEKRR